MRACVITSGVARTTRANRAGPAASSTGAGQRSYAACRLSVVERVGVSWTPSDPGAGRAAAVLLTEKGGGERADFGGLVPLDAVATQGILGPRCLPYFEVDDCDATVADVERLGGKLTLEPMEMEGVGQFANVADPYGAQFAVIKSSDAPES